MMSPILKNKQTTEYSDSWQAILKCSQTADFFDIFTVVVGKKSDDILMELQAWSECRYTTWSFCHCGCINVIYGDVRLLLDRPVNTRKILPTKENIYFL